MTHPRPDRLDAFVGELRRFVAERDWRQFHDPKNLAMALASEAGELVAEYRWVRNTRADAWSRDPENRARVEAELADTAIAVLLMADRLGIDLIEAMRAKLERNRRNYPVKRSRGRADRPRKR